MSKRKLLKNPTVPFEVDPSATVCDVLERMSSISFQGRSLGKAFAAWRDALTDEVTIMLGLAGAMVPAGMRRILVYAIENRLIDCLVSTGANLFHDIHETLGRYHYIGSPHADDTALYEHRVDRIYDTFADEMQFRKTDKWAADFAAGLDKRPYTTREFLKLLGDKLNATTDGDGIVATAARVGVPIYCPAMGDSSIALGLVGNLNKAFSGEREFQFDIIRDVRETAEIVANSPGTAVVYIGGGTPKNFIQQTEVAVSLVSDEEPEGHRYAVQFTQDSPHWGGLSGCTFEEAQSWGKIAQRARKVMCFCDATIALPLVVTGLAQTKAAARRPGMPDFSLGEKFQVRWKRLGGRK